MNLGRHLCLFVCLFLWNLAIICVRANVLRVGHSSISQNNQGVGYRVCMCIEAAMCATLTPAAARATRGSGYKQSSTECRLSST